MNLVDNNYGEHTPDNLINDTTHPIDIKGITLKSGQGVLARGTVLGIVTIGGKAALVDSSRIDGTEVANCILTDKVDTTTGDVVTTAYVSGQFNRKALVFGGTDTASDHEEQLRVLGIFLKDTVSY